MKIGSLSGAVVAVCLLLVMVLAGCFGGAASNATNETGVAFASPQAFGVGKAPAGIASADLNADGIDDLVVANAGSNTVSVLLNTTVAASPSPSPSASPNRVTTSAQTDASPSPSPAKVVLSDAFDFGAVSEVGSVTTADIDGDGRPDIVMGGPTGAVGVLLNTTSGGASTPTFSGLFLFQSSTLAQQVSVATADLNGDGRIDVVATNRGDNSVSVFLNTTITHVAPTFLGPFTFGTGGGPQQVVIRDVNADGFLDLVTANSNGSVSVLLGSTEKVTAVPQPPAPTFSRVVSVNVGDGASNALVVDDIDGDGRQDIAVATGAGNAAILLNTTVTNASPTPTPAASATPVAATPSIDVSFASAQLFGLEGTPVSLCDGPFAVGGRYDLAAALSGGTNVAVLVNRSTVGTASYDSGGLWSAGTNPAFVLALDVDGDGKTDLVVSDRTTNQISVLMNISTTPLVSAVSSPTVATSPVTTTR